MTTPNTQPTELDKAIEELQSRCWGEYSVAISVQKVIAAANRLKEVEKERDEFKHRCACQHQLLRSVFYAAEFYPNDNGYRLNKVLRSSDNGREVLAELDQRDQLRTGYKQALEALNESKISILDLVKYFDTYDTTRAALSRNVEVIESVLSTPLAIETTKGDQ